MMHFYIACMHINIYVYVFFLQCNGSIYEQKDGAAMGSPVSAVIANLYMESFEEQAITTSSYEPESGNATWTIPLPSWIAKT